MSSSEPSSHDPAEAPAPTAEGNDGSAAETPGSEYVPEVTETRMEVSLQRSVRYTRLLIVGAVLGAVAFALASLAFPVAPESEYTVGQIAGFMAVVGAVLGLALGGVLGLILAAAVKRRRGAGVAVQADVR